MTNAEVLTGTADTGQTMRVQTVPVNIYETAGALVIVAPLPAVMAGDVTIESHDGRLRFRASLRSAAPRNYLVHEWDDDGYEREVDLPDGFGGDVEATLAHSQLAMRVLRGSATGPVTVHPNSY